MEEQLIDIVSENLNAPREEITRDKRFIEDLQADSLDLVELAMEFEDKFGVTIPDDDFEKIKTVGDAIDYVKEHS